MAKHISGICSLDHLGGCNPRNPTLDPPMIMQGTLACYSYRRFLVAAFVLPRASILLLCSLSSNTFIPTKGHDSNTLKMHEYYLHLIKIPSYLCSKTSLKEKIFGPSGVHYRGAPLY